MAILFSIAPVNWTNDDDPTLGGDISLDQCLTEMKEAGFVGCELGNKFPKSVSELKSCLNRFDLALTTDWIGTSFTTDDYQQSLKYFRSRVDFLKNFGVKALKVCECGHGIQQTGLSIFDSQIGFSSAQFSQLVRGLHEAGTIAKDNGMYVAYHHHLGTGIQKQSDIDRLMAETDESLVTLLPDTGHLYAAGIDPYEIFERYISRIKYIHLKDVRSEQFALAKENKLSFMDSVRAGLFTTPGDGCIDFSPIFRLLKAKKFDGWLVVEAEQDPKKANPLQYAKRSREFLRTHLDI